MKSYPPNTVVAEKVRGTRIREAGFSLIELLAVIAVMTVMMVMAVPALTGIKGAGEITRAAFEIEGTLEQARAYAMANNTYVFVGFSERDGMDATKPGVGQVLMAAMATRDGTRSFGTSNSNLVPLSKLRRIENTHLQDSLPNSGAMSRPVVESSFRVGNEAFQAGGPFASGFTAPSGHSFTKIIQFDPSGTASIPSGTGSVPQWMEIGLVGARGNSISGGTNCAALVLVGVTGSAKIYRP